MMFCFHCYQKVSQYRVHRNKLYSSFPVFSGLLFVLSCGILDILILHINTQIILKEISLEINLA